jgi:hypothetical protein
MSDTNVTIQDSIINVSIVETGIDVSVVDTETITVDVQDETVMVEVVNSPGTQGPTGPVGPGVPSGGTQGQIIVKNSSTNYDTGWSSQNVVLGEYGIQAGFVDYDQTPTATIQRARMLWNDETRTVVLGINGTLEGHLMRDQFWYAKNQSGSTITKGQVVYASGTLGASGRILIAPFLANGTVPSRFVIGVAAENIANGQDGNVMSFGKLRNINLSAYTDGQVLYASPTVAGGFTGTLPVAPNNIVVMAFVVHAANNGVLAVRPTFNAGLYEDQNISANSPSDGDVLQYVTSTGLWTKTSSINFGTW